MTHKPHDSLFKAAFERPQDAAGLLRNLLPPEVSAAIDWSTLTLQPGTFIDEQLADRHTDLLFSVQIHGHTALLYLLLEHQSSNDYFMPLRVLGYLIRIWDRHRGPERKPLPLIIPLLLSNAVDGWTAPRNFADLFDPRVLEIPGMSQFVPNFAMVIEDLVRRSDEDLARLALAAFPTLALWLLRDGRVASRMRKSFPFWGRMLGRAIRSRRGLKLLRYLSLVLEEFYWPESRANLQQLTPAAEETIMSMAERWHREGLEQGLEQGRTEGKVQALTKLLALKFGELPAQLAERLGAASPTELDTWVERVLRAHTLDQVFAD